MNKKVILIISLIIIMLISHVFLIVRVNVLKTEINNLETTLVKFQEQEDLQILKINEGIISLLNKQEENKIEIKNELAKINQKSEAQYSKTVVMSKTYDAILEEQKKKTIDTAEKDKSIIDLKNNGISLYKKGNYAASYEIFKNLTQILSDDMECHMHKAKSLYYKNPADSSSYAEILEDIKKLKQNGIVDNEMLDIEKTIFSEKEGVDE